MTTCNKFGYVEEEGMPDLLSAVYLFIATCPQIATNLSISSYTLFKQLVGTLWITRLDDQAPASLLTIHNRPVLNRQPQAIRTHLDIGF